jgi:hypothetical protein
VLALALLAFFALPLLALLPLYAPLLGAQPDAGTVTEEARRPLHERDAKGFVRAGDQEGALRGPIGCD